MQFYVFELKIFLFFFVQKLVVGYLGGGSGKNSLFHAPPACLLFYVRRITGRRCFRYPTCNILPPLGVVV